MHGFEIVRLLHDTHLLVLAEMKTEYSEVMVRAFYQNLAYVRGELTSRVCGIDIIMTAPDWMELLGFDFDGLADAAMYDGDSHTIFDGFDREATLAETRRDDAQPGLYAHYPVSNLSVPARILHYVVTHIIFQRGHNHSKVLEGDFVVLWALLHHIPVNWRHYICMLMKRAKSAPRAELPFAFLVQRILHRFGVPMHTEMMKAATGWNALFGERLLRQCGITQSRTGVWYWRRAPEPPEAPLPRDAHMEDAGSDDDADDDDGGPTPAPTGAHPCFQPPPLPPAPDAVNGWAVPEGGWTLDHVMSSMYNLTCGYETLTRGQDTLTREFKSFRQSMGKWRVQIDKRVSSLEDHIGKSSRIVEDRHDNADEEGDDDEEEENVGDEEDDDEDTQSDTSH